jgi:hypothetical protein
MGEENFNADQQKLLTAQGFLVLDGEFEVGRVLFEEFHHYQPLKYLAARTVPALVVHGDQAEHRVPHGLPFSSRL